MSSSHLRRSSTVPLPGEEIVPPAPPLPPQQPKYSQQARYALGRVLGFGGKTHHSEEPHTVEPGPFQPLTYNNSTTLHRTGLEINALSVNEAGTHALIAGRQIFKTIRVDGDSCTEDANIRAAIRTYNASVGDHGSTNIMPKEAVDIHDVAWARGTTGNYIAAATYNGPIILYDLNRLGIEMARLFDHRRQVHRVTFNPHAGHYMLSASQDGTVRMWDIRDCQRSVTTFTSQRATPGQADGIRDVKWSPTNGTEFALGTDGGWIQKWDTQMMRTAKVKIAGHATACSTIDWHPDGKHLLSAGTDKAVRVWNVYNEGRRQKPLHEIKVPHPLRNARWRPSFQSLLHGDSGVRQCTQLVTSYDKDYPMLHVWDLRRPHLPFRELECYQTAPTDLLWHSQDLLWTVGREGIFLQSDVSYATKSIDKRNAQAFALSPQGELNVVTQTRRPKPDLPKPQLEEKAEKPRRQQTDSALLGAPTQRRIRSAIDDTLDDNFLSVSLKLSKRKSPSGNESRSLGETPPSNDMVRGRTLALDSKMERFRPVRPVQMAARGMIPGHTNTLITRYLAQKYKLRPYLFPPTVESLLKIHQVFDRNASHARLTSMYRLAQSWHIIGQMISKDLRQRAECRRRARLKRNVVTVKSLAIRDEVAVIVKEIMANNASRASNPPTPLALPVRKSGGLQLPSRGSGSNMATPRALPTDHSSAPSRSAPEDLPPREDAPKSVQAINAPEQSSEERQSTGRDTVAGLRREEMERLNWQPKPRQPLKLDTVSTLPTPPMLFKQDSEDSFMAFPLSNSRGPSLPDSASSSHLQLKGAEETFQRAEKTQHTIKEELFPTNVTGMVGDSPSPERKSLHDDDPETQERPRSSSATDHQDSIINRQMPIAVPERPRSRADKDVDMQALALNNQESFTSDTDLNPNSHKYDTELMPGAKVETTTDAHDKPLFKDSDIRDGVSRHKSGYDPRFGAFLKSGELSPDYGNDDFIVQDFLETGDTAESKNPLFTLSAMINQLVRYHTQNVVDSQTLSALLLLATPLLPEDNPLDRDVACINPLQVESILQDYHDRLMALALPASAALLRRLSYPTFPAVYDIALKDNQVSFRCSTCSKPITSGSPSSTRCDSCMARPVQCPICWSPESPYDLTKAKPKKNNPPVEDDSVLDAVPVLIDVQPSSPVLASSNSREEAPPKLTSPPSLFTTCLQCNHSAHAACLSVWHGLDPDTSQVAQKPKPTLSRLRPTYSHSGGTCPVSGCGCGCIAAAPSTASMPHRAPSSHHAGRHRVVDDESGRMSGASAGSGGSVGSGLAKSVERVPLEECKHVMGYMCI
ncbi:hypothetical protein ANO11243_034170 [Dothideomycetidae sp. 11243]|nr:hypothetical protein ANO11243_034170 [fungal sp. No.11243]